MLDSPEILWKGYIDFEIEEGESENARGLYEQLLERTGHVKVWISYAQFEGSNVGKGTQGAREIFDRANEHLKNEGLKEERVLLLDAWRVFEKANGDIQSISEVEAKMPRRVKRRRARTDENGAEIGWEEYFDYQFPEQEGSTSTSLLEMAAKWKQSHQTGDDDHDSDIDSDDD